MHCGSSDVAEAARRIAHKRNPVGRTSLEWRHGWGPDVLGGLRARRQLRAGCGDDLDRRGEPSGALVLPIVMKPSRLVVVYEGGAGVDPDKAAELVRAVVREAGKQGTANRFRVCGVILTRQVVAVKLEPIVGCSSVTDEEARQAMLVFGAVARDAVARATGASST
jgi:hypothetical protein